VASPARSRAFQSFEQFAGLCAVAAGVAAFIYALAFILLVLGDASPQLGLNLSWVLLMITGVLTSAVVVAMYQRLQSRAPALALWLLLLGFAASMGMTIHGGVEVANFIHPAVSGGGGASQIDPRGLMTFGLWGLVLLVFAATAVRTGTFPKELGYLGIATGLFLIEIYVARLTVLDATSPVVRIPAALTGFVLSPAWLIWTGRTLMRGRG
jgi:hypothetical protein